MPIHCRPMFMTSVQFVMTLGKNRCHAAIMHLTGLRYDRTNALLTQTDNGISSMEK